MALLRPPKLKDFFLDDVFRRRECLSFVAVFGSTSSPSPPFVMGSFSRSMCNLRDEETHTGDGEGASPTPAASYRRRKGGGGASARVFLREGREGGLAAASSIQLERKAADVADVALVTMMVAGGRPGDRTREFMSRLQTQPYHVCDVYFRERGGKPPQQWSRAAR